MVMFFVIFYISSHVSRKLAISLGFHSACEYPPPLGVKKKFEFGLGGPLGWHQIIDIALVLKA